MLNWTKSADTFLGCTSSYSNARTVIFGVPFDGTATYRAGARFASKVMRAESYSIETYSPYQDRDLVECMVFDGGDLELPFGNINAVLNAVEDAAGNILEDGKIPFMIGGEHLVTLGAVRAMIKVFKDLRIIHLDAHTDLRNEYLGERLSHATVLRRCWELLGDERIYQFGIRSGDREEFLWAPGHVCQRKFDLFGLDKTVKELSDMPVYLTIDMDVLDPAAFPGTGTPEAGGISFSDLVHGLLSLRGARIVGCDLVELSPPYDPSSISVAAALKAMRELLCLL